MAKSGSQKRRREAEASQELAVTDPDVSAAAPQPAPPNKKARVEERRSLFVRSLPPTATNETLTEFFSQHFPVKHATVVLDSKTKTSRGYGFVTFTDADDAIQAKEKLNNELLGGRRLRLEVAEPRHRATVKPGSVEKSSKVAEEKKKREEDLAEARKPPKLIVRNLPWSIKTPDQLSELFRGYGKVKFADLPSSKGKLSGFGFVTLRGKKNAEKAMEGLNGKVIDERTIAVDWAVDKSTWEQQQGQTESEEAPKKTKAKEDETQETKPEKTKKKKNTAGKDDGEFDEDEDIKNFMKNHMETLEDEETSSEEDSDEDEEQGGADLDESPEEDPDAEDDEQDDEEANTTKKQQLTDNSSTLFVRNIPFSTTDDQLKAHFTQFGAVRYARVVIDRGTDRPAGKCFVCFFKAEDADECVRKAPRYRPAPTLSKHSVLQDENLDSDGRYTLEGRVLQVSKAVSKEEASRLTDDAAAARRTQDGDKRRLFLLSEGQITKGSPLFSLLPAAEVQLRETSARQRKKLIEGNPSLHLSLTRLALRNIPRNMTSKELKALAREAVVGFAKDVKEGKRQPLSKEENRRGGELDKEGEHNRKLKKKGVVRQAKVVFESKDGAKVPEWKGGDGAVAAGAKSRGYGFVEYSSHRWALMGLRWLNGHALDGLTPGGKPFRLIAEFAIENANVVARRKATEERFRGGGGPQQSAAAEKNKKSDGDSSGKKDPSSRAKGGLDKTSSKASADDRGVADADGPPAGKKVAKSAGAKLAMRQQIIGRKRLMRKRKAVARGGKK